MPLDDATSKELEGILALMGSDAFDADAKQRLNLLVSGSDEARRIYLEHCQMQAMLHQSTLLDEDGYAWKSRELLTSDAVRIDASNGQIVDEASPIELPRLAEASMERLNVPAQYIESVQNDEPAHYWRFETASDGSFTDLAEEAAAVLHGGAKLHSGGVYFPRGRRNHGFVLLDQPMRSLLNSEFTWEVWVNPSFSQRSTIIDINHREPETRLREKMYRLSLMPMHDQRVYPGQSVRFACQLWPQGEKESVNVFSSRPYTPGVQVIEPTA